MDSKTLAEMLKGFNRTIFIQVTSEEDCGKLRKFAPAVRLFRGIPSPCIIRICKHPCVNDYFSDHAGWGFKIEDYAPHYRHMRIVTVDQFLALQRR